MSVTYQKLAKRVKNNLDENTPISLTHEEVHKILLTSFGEIVDALSFGEDVYLEGFGRLYPDCKPPQRLKSNITQKEHLISYKIFVRFNAFKKLNAQVQNYLDKLGLEDTNEPAIAPHAREV